jgi:hypothetical protein
MDVRRPAGTTNYEWSPEILGRHELHRSDIGVLGWTLMGKCPVTRNSDTVFLPLRIRQGPATPAAVYRLELKLLPARPLDSALVNMSYLGPDGCATPTPLLGLGATVRRSTGGGSAFPMYIPNLRDRGIYYIQVAGFKPTPAKQDTDAKRAPPVVDASMYLFVAPPVKKP